jgi:anti-anti-sigma factor
VVGGAHLAGDAAVTVTADAGRTVVRLCGELDLGIAPQLRAALLAAQVARRNDADEQPVVVDLSQVTFLSACALGVLVGAASRGRRAGSDLVLRAPAPPVVLLLEVTGLLRVLRLEQEKQHDVGLAMPPSASASVA